MGRVDEVGPGGRVVKAFNSFYWEHLRVQSDTTKALDERRVIPVAGHGQQAKQVVTQRLEAIGFGPLDPGPLREGGRHMVRVQSGYTNDLTLGEARQLIDK